MRVAITSIFPIVLYSSSNRSVMSTFSVAAVSRSSNCMYWVWRLSSSTDNSRTCNEFAILLVHQLCTQSSNQSINQSMSSIIWKIEAKDVLPNINRMQAAEMAGKMPFFVPGDLDIWPWPSNWSERGTKHVLRVNLVQICSAVPVIFHTQTKNHRLTAPKTEPSAVHCMW